MTPVAPAFDGTFYAIAGFGVLVLLACAAEFVRLAVKAWREDGR